MNNLTSVPICDHPSSSVLNEEGKEAGLTYEIIGAAMRVHNTLGPGLRESPYGNALCIELRKRGMTVMQQPALPIRYDGEIVGDCIPDLIVDRRVLVELKSIDKIGDNEIAQVLNYLRIGRYSVGLLLNFKPKRLEQRRVSL